MILLRVNIKKLFCQACLDVHESVSAHSFSSDFIYIAMTSSEDKSTFTGGGIMVRKFVAVNIKSVA